MDKSSAGDNGWQAWEQIQSGFQTARRYRPIPLWAFRLVGKSAEELAQLLADAKRRGDSKAAKEIIRAQKYLGFRNVRKRGKQLKKIKKVGLVLIGTTLPGFLLGCAIDEAVDRIVIDPLIDSLEDYFDGPDRP